MITRFEGLQQRLISALILGSAVLAIVIWGGIAFTAMIFVAALIMQREWYGLTHSQSHWGWKIGGYAYIIAPCLSVLWLRNLQWDGQAWGLELVLYVLLTVWATDIGAYFAGRTIGGPKIAPTISPNKTWAGLVGGMLSAALIGGIFSFYLPYPSSFGTAILIGALLAIVAQMGDFFESWLKRRVGAKDSGTLIPGHGGLLDRIDGLIFTAPLFALLVANHGG